VLERWVAQVFDHPGEGPEWWWDPARDRREPPPAERVALTTALFRDPLPLLARFSDAQLGRGLWYLADHACSSYSVALLDESVDLAARVECLDAVPTLFAQLFAARCEPAIAHGPGGSANPLNVTGYMWWDLFPTWGQPERATDDAVLRALAAILGHDALVCQESALHGLGHWQAAHPERVAAAIDAFVRSGRCHESLRDYAAAARGGCVQ
jgi:hypothetical protein